MHYSLDASHELAQCFGIFEVSLDQFYAQAAQGLCLGEAADECLDQPESVSRLAIAPPMNPVPPVSAIDPFPPSMR